MNAEINAKEGIKKAIDNAELKCPGWKDQAIQFVKNYPITKFMAEDVRVWAYKNGLSKPPNDRAWGAVLRECVKLRVVSHIGYQKVDNPKAHGTPASLWMKEQSLEVSKERKVMRILILDTSALLHAAKHSVGKAKLSHNEQYTFVIFGFLFKLRSILIHTRPDVIAFALDGKTSLRKQLYYSQYKGNRDDSDKSVEEQKFNEIARQQFTIVQEEIIPELGYKNIFKAEGFEADDIIGSICKTHGNSNIGTSNEICIVTTDSDMFQLIRENIVILNPKTYTYLTMSGFEKKYNIGHPNMWKRVKVYSGCSTDNVPGIIVHGTKTLRRVGIKSVINYLQNKLKPTSNIYKAFTDPRNKKDINRNKLLTILPLKNTPEFRIVKDDKLSRSALLKICAKYRFKSIEEDIEDFCKVLKLR
jgi:5'-3' exonuclease